MESKMIRRKYFLLTILVTAALVGCQAQAQAKPTAPQTAKIPAR